MKSLKFVCPMVSCVAWLLVSGCNSKSASSYSLKDSVPALDAEAARLRQMQMVRVVKQTDDPDDPENGKVVEWDDATMAMAISASCSDAAGAGDCGAMLGVAQTWYCKGELQLAIASGAQDVVLSPYEVGVKYKLPPQSTATTANLAAGAVELFQAGIQALAPVLSGQTVNLHTCAVSNLLPDQAASAANLFIDSYQKAKKAYELLGSTTLSVADAQLASSPNFQTGQARSMAGRELSRAALAHFLVGGKAGIVGSTSKALCSSGRLAGPAKRALDILRESGISPQDVLKDEATLPMARLLNGAAVGGAALPDGAVRQRLEDVWARSFPSDQTVEDFYGLKIADFQSARAYLQDEITAFSRSTTAQLPKRRLAGGRIETFARFSGITAPPSELPAAYWMAIALSEGTVGVNPTTYDGGDTVQQPTSWTLARGSAPALPGDLAFSFSTLADYVKSYAAYAAARPAFQSFFPEQMVKPLLTLATGSDVQGRVTHCYQPVDPTSHTYTVYGFKPTDGIAIVSGEDDLRCAVDGTVEGAPCSLMGSSLVRLTEPASARAEFSDAVKVNVTRSGSLLQRAYVLRARGGVTDPKPGDYVALAGFVPYYSGLSTWNPEDIICREFPIVSEALEGTAKALAASRQWCGESSTLCDGSRFDDRIPLEDELTDDGDGVESSWKHYLALAKNAATESDTLGKEYVDASLNKDLRAETLSLRQIDQQQRAAAELDKLQQICGTAVSPERILRVMGQATDGSYDLSAWVTAPCVNNQAPPDTTQGWQCLAGNWTKTWARIANELTDRDPEVAKLQKCIGGAGDTRPYVHLGDTALCLSATQVQLAKSECGTTGACEAGYTCVASADGLKLFSTRATMPDSPGRSLCDDIREFRKSPVVTDDDPRRLRFAQMLRDTFLATGNVRSLAKGLDVHLDYNDHITVSASGAKFSTGTTGSPNTSSWPCGTSGGATNCGEGEGLFCQVAACSDPTSRGAIVRRLYKAALAAKLVTWTTGDDKPSIDVPVYIDQDLDPTDAQKASANLRVGNVPIEQWTNSQWRVFYIDTNETGAEVRRATSVGAEGASYLTITAPFGASDRVNMFSFGFTRAQLDPKDLLTAYWGGLASNAGLGFFTWALQGNSTLPADAQSFLMPGSVTARVEKLSASLGPQLTLGDPDTMYLDGDGRHYIQKSLFLWPQKHPQDSSAFYVTDENFAGLVTFGQLHLVNTPTISGKPWSFDYSPESTLDGLELLCEAGLRMSGQSRSACGATDQAPQIGTVGQMTEMGSYLQCLGDDIRRRAATATFSDFPAAVVDELQSSTQGAFQTTAGTLADSVSQLRIALNDIAQSGPTIGREVQGFGQDMKDLQAAMVIYDTSKAINNVHFEATQVQQITNCFAETMRASNAGSLFGMNLAAAAATCVNSMAQIGFAEKLRDLEDQQSQAQREMAIADFNRRFTDHATALQREGLRLSSALETVRRVLGQIESERQAARRSIESAMWFLSAHAANTPAINSVSAALSETARIRYQRAFSNAKHMAFLAKRAIEQRLGLSLNEITEELPLVDAPANWASKVCDTSGIDYGSLADGTTKNFADAFIGDYVKKLENVVESYRLKHNFHEGRDTAIVSLRDDVMNLRANCSVTSPNLLLYASNLEHLDVTSSSDAAGWHLAGCEVDADGVALPNCVTPSRHQEIPLRVRPFEQTPILGYRVAFGNGGSCTAPTCGWKTGAGLKQSLDLVPGTYRLSWYTKEAMNTGGAIAAIVADAAGAQYEKSAPGCGGAANGCMIAGNDGTWNRVYFQFVVKDAGRATVSFQRPGDMSTITLAAPMLERVDNPTFSNSTPDPKVFSDTTDQRTLMLPVCEDTSGTLFRAVWTRGCEKLCPDGFASDCRERAQTHCYRQTSFDLSQRTAETGQLFKAAGFALGNFNYRVESVALNFVGTGLHNCADSNLPATCNAAGFVPYTLIHDGPYFVRNYQGVDFLANLFSGRIEHARGLATERYLTNPMSSSDQSLLEPFLRTEFRGRPLDGSFVLRVWDEDSAVFDAVQDVQIALTYRYWTRFN